MESALWFRQRCLKAEESHFKKQRAEMLRVKQEHEEKTATEAMDDCGSSIETIFDSDEEEQQFNEYQQEILQIPVKDSNARESELPAESYDKVTAHASLQDIRQHVDCAPVILSHKKNIKKSQETQDQSPGLSEQSCSSNSKRLKKEYSTKIVDCMPDEKNKAPIDCDTAIDAGTSVEQVNKESEGSSGMFRTDGHSFGHPETKEADSENKIKNNPSFEYRQQNEVRGGVEKQKESQQNAREDSLIVFDSEDDDDDELLVEILKYSKKIEKRTGKQKITCPHCAKKFFSNSRLQSHLVSKHKLNIEESLSLKRVFKCNIDGCDKTFKTAVWLKIHKAAHAGENQRSMPLTMLDFCFL
jgi:hypothetical protein